MANKTNSTDKNSPASCLDIEQHQLDEKFMREAILLAQEAEQHDEIPVGAIVVANGEIIARGFNQSIMLNDPSAHAEMIAIRRAGEKIQNYRLIDCTLYVTLEPCPMCAGLLVHSRINRLVFGAKDLKTGCAGSVFHITNSDKLNHQIPTTEGVLAQECSQLLSAFFKRRRSEKKSAKKLAQTQGQIPSSPILKDERIKDEHIKDNSLQSKASKDSENKGSKNKSTAKNNYKIIKATPAHIETLRAWFPTKAEIDKWAGPNFRFPHTKSTFLHDINAKKLASYCLIEMDRDEKEGAVIAFGQFYQRLNHCHLGRLAVNPAYRGQGVASHLIDVLAEVGKKALSLSSLSLFVLADNTPALNLYKKLGFKEQTYPEEIPLDHCLYLIKN